MSETPYQPRRLLPPPVPRLVLDPRRSTPYDAGAMRKESE